VGVRGIRRAEGPIRAVTAGRDPGHASASATSHVLRDAISAFVRASSVFCLSQGAPHIPGGPDSAETGPLRGSDLERIGHTPATQRIARHTDRVCSHASLASGDPATAARPALVVAEDHAPFSSATSSMYPPTSPSLLAIQTSAPKSLGDCEERPAERPMQFERRGASRTAAATARRQRTFIVWDGQAQRQEVSGKGLLHGALLLSE